MQEHEGRLNEIGHEFLEAHMRQTRTLQAEQRAHAYAAEEYARARHHAAQVAQFAGHTQDLQERMEHIVFVGRTEMQALHTRVSAQHRIIEIQEHQMNHFVKTGLLLLKRSCEIAPLGTRARLMPSLSFHALSVI